MLPSSKQFADMLPGMVCIVQEDGSLTCPNKPFRTFFNLDSPGQLTYVDIPALREEPKLAQRMASMDRKTFATGKASWSVITIAKNTPSEASLLCYRTPFTHKKQLCLLLHLWNVSNRLLPEVGAEGDDALLALENITANMPGHIYWKDRNGVYLGCNDRQARSIGLSYGYEVVGKTDFELPWTEGAAQQFRDNDLRIMHRQKAEIVEEPSVVDGRDATVLSHKAPLFDKYGVVQGVVGISIDITDLKIVERQLREANVAVAKADQLKSEFIRNMQHDIRTPFVGLYTFSMALADQEHDDEKKALLLDLHQCAKELLSYCNEILDFSKIEGGSMPVTEKTFYIGELIESVVAMEKPSALQKGLELDCDIDDSLPPVILSDPYRIRQILLNLVSNAIKFTETGHVNVSATLHKGEVMGRELVLALRVSDTGIGIAKDQQDFIYEKFSKLSPSNKGVYKGYGLGLSIVKQFIEDLGGEIHLDSGPGVGAIFTLLLPVRKALIDTLVDEYFSTDNPGTH